MSGVLGHHDTKVLEPSSPPSARVVHFFQVAVLAAAASFVHRGVRTRSLHTVAHSTAEDAEKDLLEEARAAAEAAKLELQAAKLRAEADMLEKANAIKRRDTRAGDLLSGSISEDGSYRLSIEALPAKMKEVTGFECTEADAKRLAASCGREAEADSLSFADLASVKFDAELEKIMAEAREAKALADQEAAAAARARQSAARSKQSAQQNSENPAVDENDDRSMNTRVLSCLAYMLPLVDGIQFGLYVLQIVPVLAPFFALLAIPAAIVNAVPFGSVLLFAAWVILSNNTELPRLVRFNLQQAVLLDVAFFLPNLLAAASNGGELPPEVAGFFFLGLMVVVGYCVVRNVDGEYPDGIPLLSDTSKRILDGPGGPGPFGR